MVNRIDAAMCHVRGLSHLPLEPFRAILCFTIAVQMALKATGRDSLHGML